MFPDAGDQSCAPLRALSDALTGDQRFWESLSQTVAELKSRATPCVKACVTSSSSSPRYPPVSSLALPPHFDR